MFCAVFRAAAPGLVAVLLMWDSTCIYPRLLHPRPMAGEWSHQGVCCHPASDSLDLRGKNGVHAFGYNSAESEPIWMKSGAL